MATPAHPRTTKQSRKTSEAFDVVVAGAGNAASCAALAAAQAGARVLMVDAAPPAQSGGNTRFTNGAYRVAYDGAEDLVELVPSLRHSLDTANFTCYPVAQFVADVLKTSEGHSDRALVERFAAASRATLRWLREAGIPFEVGYDTLGARVDGRCTFSGGLVVQVVGIGPGIVEAQHRACVEHGVIIRHAAPATKLHVDGDRIAAIDVRIDGATQRIACDAVVLACGGFEANAEMRARYLGPGWDLAKVRGSRYNTGTGIGMALEVGAVPFGHWSGCHAIAWDAGAAAFGEIGAGVHHQRHAYPLGIMVNARGERFVDEGADLRNFTYARNGGAILAQPGMIAWQVFDRKVRDLLPREYRQPAATRVTGDTLDALAVAMGIDPVRLVDEITRFNVAVCDDKPFNGALTVKDGRATAGLPLAKSNWANRIDEPPYEAFGVTCGITFTYGGLRISANAEVEDVDGRPIPGLYAAGEIVGGLYYFNYPGGTGLTSGAVFGRIAGSGAAAFARASSR